MEKSPERKLYEMLKLIYPNSSEEEINQTVGENVAEETVEDLIEELESQYSEILNKEQK